MPIVCRKSFNKAILFAMDHGSHPSMLTYQEGVDTQHPLGLALMAGYQKLDTTFVSSFGTILCCHRLELLMRMYAIIGTHMMLVLQT